MEVLYEDNHLIVVSKRAGEITQGDKTGDTPLPEVIKQHIKVTCHKPGRVYLGVVHRLDRPVSGVCLFAKTSKALARLNRMFAEHGLVEKTYWAITAKRPDPPGGTLTHWLTRDSRNNTARAHDHEVPGSKKAVLDYEVIGASDRYFLLQVRLRTGRHHQIRCQLAKIGCPVKGDLKYGAPRSNPDGSICLHARTLRLEHPVTRERLEVTAPLPEGNLWQAFAALAGRAPGGEGRAAGGEETARG